MFLAHYSGEKLQFRDADSFEVVKTLPCEHKLGHCLCVSPDNTKIVVQLELAKKILIFDCESGQVIGIIHDTMTTIAFDCSGNLLVCRSYGGRGFVFDIAVQAIRFRFFVTAGLLGRPPACFTVDSRWIIGSFSEGRKSIGLVVWDANTGQNTETGNLRAHSEQIRCICASPKGDVVVTGADDKLMIVWDVSSLPWSQAQQVPGQNMLLRDHFSHLAFSRDGSHLASISITHLTLWDVTAGYIPIWSLPCRGTHLSFHPAGLSVAVAAWVAGQQPATMVIRIFTVASGDMTFECPTDAGMEICFSAPAVILL